MRSTFAADVDREQSLAAMWHALRASNFAGRNQVEIDAGVVPALLNARYYHSARGQFLSQDPSFLTVGDFNQVKSVTGQDQRLFLADPQQMNSYSYGRDNPVSNKDPQGNQSIAAVGVSALIPLSIFQPELAPLAIATGILLSNSMGYNDVAQKAQNYNNNRGGRIRFIPFGQQGREVMPPNYDPDDPFRNMTGPLVISGATIAAAELIKQVNDTPSNKIVPTSEWRPLPSIPIQGARPQNQQSTGTRSSALYAAQIASIQTQINQIRAQVNAIAQGQASSPR